MYLFSSVGLYDPKFPERMSSYNLQLKLRNIPWKLCNFAFSINVRSKFHFTGDYHLTSIYNYKKKSSSFPFKTNETGEFFIWPQFGVYGGANVCSASEHLSIEFYWNRPRASFSSPNQANFKAIMMILS